MCTGSGGHPGLYEISPGIETRCPQWNQRRARCPNLQGGQGVGIFFALSHDDIV